MTSWSRRRVLAATTAAISIEALATRCARAAAQGKITVGVEAGSPYEKYFSSRAPLFTKATGIETELIGIPHDNIHQQFVQDALAGGGAYDVYIADQVWLPEFAEKGFVQQLDDKIGAADRADFAGSALETVTYKGSLFALPFIVHNCAMYYRTDLLRAAGLGAAPATWDEYRHAAKALTKADGSIFGTLIEGKQNIEAATHFHALLQQAGGDVLDAQNKPTIDSDAAHKALELMTAIMFDDRSSPQGLLDLTDIQGLWLQGKLAMAAVWPYLYSLSKDPKQSKVAGNYAVDLQPGNPDRVATVFSWGFCVAAGAKNPSAAVEWVKWAASTDTLTDFGIDQLNPVPRKSALQKVLADPRVGEADKAAIATFSRSAAASRTLPMVPQYPQLLDQLAVVISAVMSRAQTPEQALKAAQAKAEEIMTG